MRGCKNTLQMGSCKKRPLLDGGGVAILIYLDPMVIFNDSWVFCQIIISSLQTYQQLIYWGLKLYFEIEHIFIIHEKSIWLLRFVRAPSEYILCLKKRL